MGLPGTRIWHTSEEKNLLVLKAAELLKLDSRLSERQLFIRSQAAALPPERHRQTITLPRKAYEWLFTEAMAQIDREQKQAKSLPVAPVAPERVGTEPVVGSGVGLAGHPGEPGVVTGRVLAEALAARLGIEEQVRDDKLTRLESTVQGLVQQVSGLTSQVQMFSSLLEKIIGDLSGHQEEQSLKTPINGVIALESKPASPQVPKQILPKIVVMGLDRDRFQSLQGRVGLAVDLRWVGLNQRFGDEAIRNSDLVLIAPMVNHSDAKRVKDLIGSNRVIRPRHGGIDIMVQEILRMTGSGVRVTN